MSVSVAVLRFVVPGEPVGKERARVFSRTKGDGGTITRAVTPPKTRAYEDKIRTVAQIAVNQSKWTWSEDDRFSIIVRIHRTHFDAGGDASNVLKCLEDACNRITWSDDRYVRGIGVAILDPDPKNPRVEVEVRRYAVEKPKPRKKGKAA